MQSVPTEGAPPPTYGEQLRREGLGSSSSNNFKSRDPGGTGGPGFEAEAPGDGLVPRGRLCGRSTTSSEEGKKSHFPPGEVES